MSNSQRHGGWMVGQSGQHLTRCWVSVKHPQSSGFDPWRRSAGNHSNLSIKDRIPQSTFAQQIACTCEHAHTLSSPTNTNTHTHTQRQTHLHTPLSLVISMNSRELMSQPQDCRFTHAALWTPSIGCVNTHRCTKERSLLKWTEATRLVQTHVTHLQLWLPVCTRA